MSAKGHEPRIVLLSDEPSDADDFDAKAHESVAKAIANLIETEAGGKVIGLEGSWGAGKSTVVRLLRTNLERPRKENGSETRVLVFDAWAHQGDPLRRTFLETLIRELESASWLPETAASEFRKKLSGRASRTLTTSTARLSLEGKLASAAVLLIPLGAVLVQNQFRSHHRAAQIVGLVLALAPLLVAAIFGLAKLIGIVTGGRRRDAGRRKQLAGLPWFSFFAKEQKIDTTTESFDRGEPTSVEFEHLFSKVLGASLTDSRRLLIVLDNLDRVQEDDAKTVLATMQTFTSSGDHLATPWRPRVWTLIPYDPAGLDRLWHPKSVGEDEAERLEDEAERLDVDKPLTASASAAFVEKVFQVRFEAPPLVLSDWRSYLMRLVLEAIPGTDDEAIQAVLRLRALYPGVEQRGLVAREAPTPRQLKQFVNQIGSIRRQRDDVSLVHLAYYALLRRDRVNVAARLIDQTLPHPKLAHLLGEEIQEDLAALHFGTVRSLAQQLLLGAALEKAFTESNSSAIQGLKDRAGFVEALESLDLTSRAGDGGVALTRALAVLDEAGALGGVQSVESWFAGIVLPFAKTAPPWLAAGRESGVGLAVLLDNLSPSDDDGLAQQLGRIEAKSPEADVDGRLHLEGLGGLLDELIRRGRATESLRVKADIPAERMPSSIAFFKTRTENQASWAALDVTSEPAEVAQVLVAAATSDNFGDVQAALEVLLARHERVDLGVLVSGCIGWLREQDAVSEEQLSTLLEVVDQVRRAGLADVLTTAADDGTLMHLVGFANRNGWSREAANASMLHLLAQPGVGDPSAVREAPAGIDQVRSMLTDPAVAPEVVSSQLDWLSAHADEAADLLMRVLAADPSSQPWVDHHLSGLHGAATLAISSAQYLNAWRDLQRALENDGFAQLTSNLLSKRANRKAIATGSRDPALAIAVLAAVSDETSAKDVRAWSGDIVKETSAADWEAVLASPEGGPILALALQVADWVEGPLDPPGLSDALHSHSQRLAASEPAWQPDGATFEKLTSFLAAGARQVVASQLCAELEGRDGRVGPGLFATYGPFLAGEREFRTHAKLPNFVERAVAHDEWDSVQWIVELATSHRDTLQLKNRKEGIEHLKTRVREKIGGLSEAGSEPPEALNRLSELLGA